MTQLFDQLPLGEVIFEGKDLRFVGQVFVRYSGPDIWFISRFEGIFTDKSGARSLPYRGRWTEGEDFDRLVKAFMDDARLVEVGTQCIKRGLNIFKEFKDDRN